MIFKKYEAIKYFKKNIKGRDFVVSDIHGNFSELEKIMEKVNFNKNTDRLFSVGDIVDRGEESCRVLDFITQKWFINVKGNHEAMWIAQKKYTVEQTEKMLLKSSYSWYADLDEKSRDDFYNAIKFLPLAINVETNMGNIAIVHADLPTATWAIFEKQVKQVNNKIIQLTMRSHERLTNYNQVVPDLRAIICGHMNVKKCQVHGNFHMIDTGGGFKDGHITMLSLENLEEVN